MEVECESQSMGGEDRTQQLAKCLTDPSVLCYVSYWYYLACVVVVFMPLTNAFHDMNTQARRIQTFRN